MTFWERNQLKLAPFLFLAPAIFVFSIYVVYPIIDSIWVSLHLWNGMDKSGVRGSGAPNWEWVGLQNYITLFTDDDEFYVALFNNVRINDMRKKSIELTELFIEETDKNCPDLELVSPRQAESRGAHLAYSFKNGYALMQCLIENGVIGDFRSPNLIRFGFNPLFIDKNDLLKASEILAEIMTEKKWNRRKFKLKSYVT